jgi:hypothetical protein
VAIRGTGGLGRSLLEGVTVVGDWSGPTQRQEELLDAYVVVGHASTLNSARCVRGVWRLQAGCGAARVAACDGPYCPGTVDPAEPEAEPPVAGVAPSSTVTSEIFQAEPTCCRSTTMRRTSAWGVVIFEFT